MVRASWILLQRERWKTLYYIVVVVVVVCANDGQGGGGDVGGRKEKKSHFQGNTRAPLNSFAARDEKTAGLRAVSAALLLYCCIIYTNNNNNITLRVQYNMHASVQRGSITQVVTRDGIELIPQKPYTNTHDNTTNVIAGE